ncbi:sulfotransferase family protein [Mycobacterium sp. CBMA247]|nr:sulfotransferase family protein [Mycolicibacterium sp. CBMA 329]MUL89224.1 sulfotransferase family protein [Mycolicibacterium sp. CBMA 331]MUL97791.1 sulfotransferase family protein [Mycolicibacterium sp. CBMA 334]MUM25298.1 sulfotransferase family protein [Mycolicibacterium sp. CBMA 295]MUM38740.1 sulfotransferase family protein [Mycolicibacterium sp. CBMA 247]MUM45288.1 sulfotransferase family protein [Mycolicibacterium sp. CBMA 294]
MLFVLGMGRSGTSALTRVLSLCGAALPSGMMGADRGNARGYWEPRAGLYLNEKFLYRHGSSYFDPTLRLQEEGGLTGEETAAFTAKIRDYLQTLPAAPVVVVKVLHISVLAHMWFDAARQAGFDIAAVLAVRDPQEVTASLAKFMEASPQLSSALWLKYNLLAERETRGLPRVFVDYSNFLDDWRREIKRISHVLPVDLDTGDQAAVEKFLTKDLRHQRQSSPVIEPFGTNWLSVTYDALSAAARDEPWDEAALDHVFEGYQASEHGFRTAIEDFRGQFSRRYRFSRAFMKPVYEGVALVHGRRGTWA